MGEEWLQLQAHRASRDRTAKAVDEIKVSWAADKSDAEKDDVAARFNGTYEQVVEALRTRYSQPSDKSQDDSAAWFAGNEALSKDLDDLFAKLKARETEVAEVEARITKEKQKWYRDALRNSVVGNLARKELGPAAFNRDVLGEKKAEDGGDAVDAFDWDAARKRVEKSLPATQGDPPSAEDVLSKLEGAVDANEEETHEARTRRIEALIDLFFRDPATGGIPASCEAAAEALRKEEGEEGHATLGSVMGKLLDNRNEAAGARAQADRHRRSLADLKRAQAAHEQDKISKAANRQRKQDGPRVEAGIYESLPHGADLRDLRVCALCRVFSGLGLGRGWVYDPLAEEGFKEAHEQHVREEHACASGDECVQLTDEDVDMTGGDDDRGPVICRECAEDRGRMTVYCSPRCAGSDFRRHREEIHLPGRRGSGAQKGDKDVDYDVKDLVFDGEDKSRYHAGDISRFVWGIEEALEMFFKDKNPDVEILSVG